LPVLGEIPYNLLENVPANTQIITEQNLRVRDEAVNAAL
jgi:hypothetical protein